MLQVNNLSLTFGKRTLFKDVNLKFTPGNCYGVIGANGAGKSTFLKVLSGDIDSTNGDVVLTDNERMSVLKQDHNAYDGKDVIETVIMGNKKLYNIMKEKEEIYSKPDFNDADGLRVGELEAEFLEMDGWQAESDAEILLAGIGLDRAFFYDKMENLSGEDKVKVLLAQSLFGNPDILILDEPTNYLDVEHIEWLKNYLINYENAFILISHDVPFLNTCINVVYHVDAPSITRYTGNYDNFVSVYETKKKQLEAAYNRQQAEIEKMEDFIARNKARVATRGMANSRMKQLNKMERIELKKEKIKPEFAFQYSSTPSKYLFIANDVVIGYDYPLSKPMTFTLEKNKKVAIVGANGIGKTTLLKSLLGIIDVLSGSIEHGENIDAGYFVQEEKASSQTCMQELWDTFPAYSQYEVRSALAKCGLTTEQIESQVFVLSGGEQAKLRLCKIMNTPCNLLVLDEPTNHLDQDAKDSLKEAIQAFKGTVLLVSHEPYFYEDIVDEVWDMSQYSI